MGTLCPREEKGSVLKEFKEFAMRGNVLDMAIGIILGTAFGKIISSLVSDVMMPPIGLLLGRMDFSNLYLNLTRNTYASLQEAKKAGAATINYGTFINTMIDFLIVAFVIFLLVRAINRMKRAEASSPAPAPAAKECPFCLSSIPLKAVRCAHCTSELKAA